jgi:hypothetical protein
MESEALALETPVAVEPLNVTFPTAVTPGQGTVVKFSVTLELSRFVVQLSRTKISYPHIGTHSGQLILLTKRIVGVLFKWM